MASRFTEETLVEHYVRFRARAGEPVDEDTARAELVAHAGELDPASLRRPRLVLVAGAFPPVVTATAVWLTEMGLDISMQRGAGLPRLRRPRRGHRLAAVSRAGRRGV